jgi:hypothetical protein
MNRIGKKYNLMRQVEANQSTFHYRWLIGDWDREQLTVLHDDSQFFVYKHTWMDGLKVGEIKISARGSQIGPNVHHTDEKSKDQKETNRQIG